MDDLYRGQQIGKYEILTQLTLGGMAELFLAFTSGPGGFRKYVVVKRILPDVRGDDQFVKMFLDEARITAAFSHPNIAQVFDLGEEEEGLYLAMEFIAGQNLNQVAAACRRRKQPIPIGFSCAVARDVCHALHYAHTFTDPVGHHQPVVHRDVAQKNVMVAYDGVTKLLDFGIAKAKGKLGRTKVGMVKGTTGYMSPEQVRGEEIDGRSDVFGLGVMLHEMLTGQRLFSARTELEEMQLILNAPVPRVSEINPLVSQELSEAVHRALSRERADRFATARDFGRAIERASANVLFDPEQMASFMRELFEQKMAATRALLESAGVPDSTLARAAIAQLRTDEGQPFDEPAPRKPDTDPNLAPPKHASTVTAAPAPASEPIQRESRWGTVVAILIALIIVGGGYGVYRVVFSLPPAPEDVVRPEQKALKPFVDGRIKTFQEPGQVAEAEPDGGSTAGSAATAANAASPNLTPTPTPAPAKKVAEGSLTLVTNPESTVVRGKQVIGKTPLFKATLPVGTHLLRLLGPDGKTYLLSAPIKANSTTMFRVKLADLPKE